MYLFDKFMEYIIFLFLAVIVSILLIPFGIYGCVQEYRKPTFELKKDEWICNKFYKYNSMYFIHVGKAIVPQQRHHKDCIQWNKM